MDKNKSNRPKTTAADQPAASAPPEMDAPQPAAAAVPEAAASETALAQLQSQMARLQADFDNYRKRSDREKIELCDQANRELMLALLPVLDHMQLGLQAVEEHAAADTIREGLSLIHDELTSVLTKFGLTAMQATGQPFDPHNFEAVAMQPSAEIAEGVIVQTVRTGYRLRDRLLREARVIVSSGPPAEAGDNAPA